MKILLFVACVVMSFPAFAFNAGPSSRSNFGSVTQANDSTGKNNSTATRTATTYSSRYKLSQGVQAPAVPGQTVEADMKGLEDVPPAVVETPKVVASDSVAEKKTKMAAAKTPSKAVPQPITAKLKEKPKEETPAATPAANAPVAGAPAEAVPAEATAAMAQFQGMMKSLGMDGAAANGGMPDLSALMGGAGAAQQPAKK